MAGISISPARRRVVDFTFPHWTEPSAVAINLHSNKWLYFIKPLSPLLLMMYLILPLVLAPVLWIFELWADIIARMKDDKHKLNMSGRPLCHRFWQIVFGYIQCVFYQGKNLSNRSKVSVCHSDTDACTKEWHTQLHHIAHENTCSYGVLAVPGKWFYLTVHMYLVIM